MNDDLLTVAQAAERLGTTIPRLRRLLARPEMAQVSRVVPVETLRGTRTSTVVPVSELTALDNALKSTDVGAGTGKHEQTRSVTFSEMEFTALQTTLRRTEELLASKNQELASKEEIIHLLREKIVLQEQEHPNVMRVLQKEFGFAAAAPSSRPEMGSQLTKRVPVKRSQDSEKPPRSVWARFYRWFREA